MLLQEPSSEQTFSSTASAMFRVLALRSRNPERSFQIVWLEDTTLWKVAAILIVPGLSQGQTENWL